jgi:hypothetical protein
LPAAFTSAIKDATRISLESQLISITDKFGHQYILDPTTLLKYKVPEGFAKVEVYDPSSRIAILSINTYDRKLMKASIDGSAAPEVKLFDYRDVQFVPFNNDRSKYVVLNRRTLDCEIRSISQSLTDPPLEVISPHRWHSLLSFALGSCIILFCIAIYIQPRSTNRFGWIESVGVFAMLYLMMLYRINTSGEPDDFFRWEHQFLFGLQLGLGIVVQGYLWFSSRSFMFRTLVVVVYLKLMSIDLSHVPRKTWRRDISPQYDLALPCFGIATAIFFFAWFGGLRFLHEEVAPLPQLEHRSKVNPKLQFKLIDWLWLTAILALLLSMIDWFLDFPHMRSWYWSNLTKYDRFQVFLGFTLGLLALLIVVLLLEVKFLGKLLQVGTLVFLIATVIAFLETKGIPHDRQLVIGAIAAGFFGPTLLAIENLRRSGYSLVNWR